MNEKMQQMVQGLTKWYWSDKFPTSYVDSKKAGIGRVALDAPGAFNITWAKYRENLIGQEQVHYFAVMSIQLGRVQVKGETLETYASLYTYKQFRDLYLANYKTMPSPLTELLSPSFHEKI